MNSIIRQLCSFPPPRELGSDDYLNQNINLIFLLRVNCINYFQTMTFALIVVGLWRLLYGILTSKKIGYQASTMFGRLPNRTMIQDWYLFLFLVWLWLPILRSVSRRLLQDAAAVAVVVGGVGPGPLGRPGPDQAPHGPGLRPSPQRGRGGPALALLPV